ncbi:MAG: caspase family protein [Terriglobia bacterium]
MRISTRRFTSIGLLLSLLVFSVPTSTAGLSNPNQIVQGGQKPTKPGEAREPVKRALLVGIGVYQPQQADEKPKDPGVVKSETAHRQPAPVARGGGRASFTNLDGPKNDLAAMREVLTRKYGFTVIETLEDQKATRAAILAAIRRDLIDGANAGDVCVFYYSGHGSRVRNSKGGESDGYDESVVPADSNQGALDIRDKELARLFLEALKKGVTLTAIFDSCHSGSIARGYPMEEKSRMLPYIETDVAEEPGFKEPPGDLGALILSASQDNEQAGEKRYEDTERGNFSWALTSVLNQPSVSVDEPAERIFQRVTSFMKGENVRHEPVLEGNQDRRKGPLFGKSGDKTSGGPTAALVQVKDKVIAELQGGQAIGLSKGSELRKLTPGADEKPVRLRVTEVKGLNSSEAMVIEGNAATLKQGDLFAIDRWAAPERADLKVWIPPGISKSDLARAAQEVAALRHSDNVELVEDPTEQTPAYVVQYESAGWKALMPNGGTQVLGLAPAMGKFASGIATRSPLFVNLPPSTELKQAIKLGRGTSRLSIEITKSPQEANYILAGRMNGDNIEYAWVRPGVTKEDKQKGNNPLPIRTDWTIGNTDPAAAAEELEEQAVTLSRIRGWLEIQASTSQSFPYTLALRKAGTDQIIRQGEVEEGVKYDLVLVGDEAALKRLQEDNQYVKQRRVYVFAIDSHGDSALLFNKRGDVENVYPLDSSKPPIEQPKVILLGDPGMVSMGAPFGLDTYILLASEEPIPDPFILEFKGVMTRGTGSDTPLAKLLHGIGTASRAAQTDVPLNWSIDRMYLRSVGKPQ